MQLFLRTLRSAIIGIAVFAIIIFVPAGTLRYWQGWAFIIVFAVSTNIIGIYLALYDPALLARRKKVGPIAETRPLQKIVISLCIVVFLAVLVLSPLDWRFGWSQVPVWISVLGDVLVAAGLMAILRVFRENSYGASTIEKMEGQTLIATGPYALVRHPMYVGVLIMFFGIPLALGSWWTLLLAFLSLPVLMLRIVDEEKLLHGELKGYGAYARDVRYRLVPGVW
jgi:protein-S-isoprenylcysteine O-methyltransferase Ste14